MYVGPLVGYMGAQQAAKYNGLRDVPEYSDSLNDHIENNMEEWADGQSFYEFVFEDLPTVNSYEWLPPYREMLINIRDSQVAVKPMNGRYLSGMVFTLSRCSKEVERSAIVCSKILNCNRVPTYLK